MQPAKLQEIFAWLEKASKDLKSAEWLLSSPDNLYNSVGFHCQQSAEKVLKAYLTWQDEPFEKTHSLVALVGKCLSFDQAFEGLRRAATTLTPYAVTFRYPGGLPELHLTRPNRHCCWLVRCGTWLCLYFLQTLSLKIPDNSYVSEGFGNTLLLGVKD